MQPLHSRLLGDHSSSVSSQSLSRPSPHSSSWLGLRSGSASSQSSGTSTQPSGPSHATTGAAPFASPQPSPSSSGYQVRSMHPVLSPELESDSSTAPPLDDASLEPDDVSSGDDPPVSDDDPPLPSTSAAGHPATSIKANSRRRRISPARSPRDAGGGPA